MLLIPKKFYLYFLNFGLDVIATISIKEVAVIFVDYY